MIRALAPWFGGNRILGPEVGRQLRGCTWVGVPFAGSMAEVPYLTARTLVVNDLHRHVINLARVVTDNRLRPQLVRRAARLAFHPDQLRESQTVCRAAKPGAAPDLELALNYFVCCWMGRSGKAGIRDEFNGRTAVRWASDGGDSMIRYRSALRSLAEWGRTLKRCTFETMDAFDFLARCEDRAGHGLYADPPFVGVGRPYLHNAGQTDAEQLAWHTRLRDALSRFTAARVVCRFYDHPTVQALYPPGRWTWHRLTGRRQTNEAADEVLLLNGPIRGGPAPSLFDEKTQDDAAE